MKSHTENTGKISATRLATKVVHVFQVSFGEKTRFTAVLKRKTGCLLFVIDSGMFFSMDGGWLDCL